MSVPCYLWRVRINASQSPGGRKHRKRRNVRRLGTAPPGASPLGFHDNLHQRNPPGALSAPFVNSGRLGRPSQPLTAVCDRGFHNGDAMTNDQALRGMSSMRIEHDFFFLVDTTVHT
jgi:hypothetical protein